MYLKSVPSPTATWQQKDLKSVPSHGSKHITNLYRYTTA